MIRSILNHSHFLFKVFLILSFLIFKISAVSADQNLDGNNAKIMFDPKFGNYLAGSYAAQVGDAENAAKFYKNIVDLYPENYELKIKTIKLFLISGMIVQAEELLSTLENVNLEEEIIKIFEITIDIRNKDYLSAYSKMQTLPNDGLSSFLKPVINVWLHLGLDNKSKVEEAMEQFESNSRFNAFNQYHKVLVYDLINHEKTESLYKSLLGNEETRSIRLIQSYALYLRRVGKTDESLSIVNNYLNANSYNPIIQESRYNYFNKNFSRSVNSANDGIAEVFYATAKALSESEDFFISTIFLRLAIVLRPNSSISYILLNEILEQRGKWALAIEPLSKLNTDTPLGEYSIIKIARNLNRLSRTDEAFELLNSYILRNPETIEGFEALGDLYRSKKMWVKAADSYTQAINKKKLINKNDWKVFYSLGISYERAKKWKKAEPNFKKALELQPDQPLVMNYLAYSWVEQGRNLDEALSMIERAVMLRPRDGYIADSLGWVHFRLGNFEKAVQKLERAIILEPEDPVINEHLGDAYWEVGRFREAVFQWKRALDFGPDVDLIPKIKVRIKKGLSKI